MPVDAAIAIACSLVLAPSLVRAWVKWKRIVRTLTPSRCAISLSVSPAAAHSRTPRIAGVSTSRPPWATVALDAAKVVDTSQRLARNRPADLLATVRGCN